MLANPQSGHLADVVTGVRRRTLRRVGSKSWLGQTYARQEYVRNVSARRATDIALRELHLNDPVEDVTIVLLTNRVCLREAIQRSANSGR